MEDVVVQYSGISKSTKQAAIVARRIIKAQVKPHKKLLQNVWKWKIKLLLQLHFMSLYGF